MSTPSLNSEAYIESVDELLDALFVTRQIPSRRRHIDYGCNPWLCEVYASNQGGLFLCMTEVGCFWWGYSPRTSEVKALGVYQRATLFTRQLFMTLGQKLD